MSRDTARLVAAQIARQSREEINRNKRVFRGEVMSISPLSVELYDSETVLEDEDLVLSQGVQQYDATYGIEEGDVVLLHEELDDWTVTDVIGDKTMLPAQAYFDATGTATSIAPVGGTLGTPTVVITGAGNEDDPYKFVVGVPAGLTGAAGVDGKTILNGSGAPSSGLGTNGDFYIDTTNRRLYGPKASGSWGAYIGLVSTVGADNGLTAGGTASDPVIGINANLTSTNAVPSSANRLQLGGYRAINATTADGASSAKPLLATDNLVEVNNPTGVTSTATNGVLNVYLPAAATIAGKVYQIRNNRKNTTPRTTKPSIAIKINEPSGASTRVLPGYTAGIASGVTMTVISTGSVWRVLAATSGQPGGS